MLINEINKDRVKLKEPRTINSLEDDRILDIGNYAGEKYEWQSAISLYISDVKIFSQNANISYRAVSSKQPVLPSDSDNSKWEDYLDTVDLYDYMFNRKVPVVYAEVDYSVEAMPDNYPSMYKINLSEIRFVDTNTSKVIQVIKPAKTSYKFTVTPIVDVLAFSSKLNQNITSDKQEAKQSKSEAAPKKEKKQNNKNPVFDQSQGGGNRFNLGVTFIFILVGFCSKNS